MPDVSVHRIVKASLKDVWASWDKFGAIARFNPNLNSSHLLPGSCETGRGAERQCNLADGKNYIRERIVDYAPQSRIVIDVYDGTLPLKSAKTTVSFRATGSKQTEVLMRMEFVPKMGLLGRTMVPMMKPQFKKLLNGLLKGNANFVERGVTLNAA